MEGVPFAITDPSLSARHSNLDVASAHVQVEKQVTIIQLQPEKMPRLKICSVKSLNEVNDKQTGT